MASVCTLLIHLAEPIYLPEVHTCAFAEELEEINHTLALAITGDRLQQFKHVSTDDPVMQALRETILQG